MSANDQAIIDVLLDTEFVTEKSFEAAGKDNVPEFLLMKELLKSGTMHIDDIKEKIEHPLTAVALKNLISAEMVEESNDNYTITDDMRSKLSG